MRDNPGDGTEQLRTIAEDLKGLAARLRSLGAAQEQSLQQPRRWRGPDMEDVDVDDLPAVWERRLTPAEAANLNDQRVRLLEREAERQREDGPRSTAGHLGSRTQARYGAHGGHRTPLANPRRRRWFAKLLYWLVPKRGLEPRHPCGH
jgi:hypothetical protein